LKDRLFKTSKGDILEFDFKNFIENFDILDKDVLVYSRLLDFGRIQNVKAVESILSILKKAVGEKGTLLIPTYTLNTYMTPRIYNENKSKIMSGVLGEYSVKDSDFIRTFHPIYSTSIYGKNRDYYMAQDETTCFGEGSLFDLFSKTNNGIVLMLGLNFNGPTLYHYYDQKFNAKGRYIKSFKIKIHTTESEYSMKLNSYVKNRDFYINRFNCLAMFDSLANKLKLKKTDFIGDGMCHAISEKTFQKLYKTALEVDQEYFLLSKEETWTEYYMKNNFDMFYDSISEEKFKKFKLRWDK
jgi:aminoglycoside 3-N-acetyltransferase